MAWRAVNVAPKSPSRGRSNRESTQVATTHATPRRLCGGADSTRRVRGTEASSPGCQKGAIGVDLARLGAESSVPVSAPSESIDGKSCSWVAPGVPCGPIRADAFRHCTLPLATIGGGAAREVSFGVIGAGSIRVSTASPLACGLTGASVPEGWVITRIVSVGYLPVSRCYDGCRSVSRGSGPLAAKLGFDRGM